MVILCHITTEKRISIPKQSNNNQSSFRLFKITHAPTLVEIGFGWRIEAQIDPPELQGVSMITNPLFFADVTNLCQSDFLYHLLSLYS